MWYDIYNKLNGKFVVTIEIDQHALEQIQRDFLLEMKAAEYVKTEVEINTHEEPQFHWAVGD